MWLNNVIFKDRELKSEHLELGARDALYYLGPNLTLRNCTLVLKVPTRRLLIPGARLIDCTIEVKKDLKNFRWDRVHLKGCRFTGALTGNDFGEWPDEPGEGSIEHCDFSAALLDACRFMSCDTSTLRFPVWPCLTLLDPVRRLGELSQVPWPGQSSNLARLLSDELPELSALTLLATTLGKDWGASEAQIKAALEHLDHVLY